MKLTVAKKMWLGFGTILALLIIVGLISLWTTIRLNSDYSFLLDDRVKKVQLIDELILKHSEIQDDVRGYMLFRDLIYLEAHTKHVDRSKELIKELDGKLQNSETRVLLDELRAAQKKYLDLQNEIILSINAEKELKANELGRASANVGIKVLGYAQLIKEEQYTALEQTRSELKKFMIGLKLFVIGMLIFATIVGVVISTFISNNIARPVRIVTEGLNEMSTGNLTIKLLSVKNKDEIGEMATAFNKMGSDVARMVRKINMSAVHLATQSEELSASSEESLATSEMVAKSAENQMIGSEKQQRIIIQSVSSLEELSLSVAEISSNNEEMLQSTEIVTNLVTKGSNVVEEVSAQMSTIHSTIHESFKVMMEMSQHSDKIQSITALITDISNQTNLLALNAAIEAARAGEYGKGFAVVAEEVRKLAEQSKRSASEIESMITMILEASKRAVTSIIAGGDRVATGIAATELSWVVFDEIQQAVGDVASKVETVSAAIEEIQAMAVEVTNGANEVQHLSSESAASAGDTSAATEEQLAVTEEISASAQALSKLADDLQMEMKHFRI
ncbi:methyl-accepting chemotaxis protein [Sporosarcina limicola]|uniref:Methyl-accepting chemotaxis protein n=1 Tax=Sporosarcina limicola TaxID=34101 RepID=A0A927R4W0_9BACL|nr:methyl-accepting chemotaxis protein [Sporosarcina limicola]MBE1556651.1 methyl-accepting chemotaxis protein [Sporosarcina limicola]